MTRDPRITQLRNLLWVTIIGSSIFSAPATMPQNPAAVPTALALAAWSLAVTVLGLRTLKQVGLSNSGLLTPFLLLLVVFQSTMFFTMAYCPAA